MDNFTWIDGIAAAVILLSALLAYSRGIVREGMAILGWIGAAVVAFLLAPAAKPIVSQIPMVGEFLGESCELSVVAAFACVFALALIVAALFTPLLSSLIQRSALGGVDQALGFLFGVLRGVLLIAVAFIVWDRAMSNMTYAPIDESRTARVFANFQSSIDDAIPSDAPGWILARYNDLTNICPGNGAAGITPAPETPAAPATPATPATPAAPAPAP